MQNLLRTAAPGEGEPKATAPPPYKPTGDIKIRAESVKFHFDKVSQRALGKITLILTNTSPTITHGFALPETLGQEVQFANKQSEPFVINSIAGVARGYMKSNGQYVGDMTELPPGAAVHVTIDVTRYSSNKEDPPFRLQTPFFWAVQKDGRFVDAKNYHLLMDID